MKKIFYISLGFVLLSCSSKKEENPNKVSVKTAFNTSQEHIRPISIKKTYLKDIEDWKEYKLVEESTVKFYKISPNEALNNAIEIKKFVNQLKDSIKPEIFNTPSFKARINVLHNETERLEDLTFITAITKEEINLQVSRVLESFSALNAKINLVLSQKKFEDEIKVSKKFVTTDTINLKNEPQKKRVISSVK